MPIQMGGQGVQTPPPPQKEESISIQRVTVKGDKIVTIDLIDKNKTSVIMY